MYLNAKLFSNVFESLSESLVVWNCNGGSAIVVVSVSSVVVVVAVAVCFCIVYLQHHPLYGPRRILACCQCCFHIF